MKKIIFSVTNANLPIMTASAQKMDGETAFQQYNRVVFSTKTLTQTSH